MYIGEVVLQKLQYKKKSSTFDRCWAKQHPELFYDVVQEYIAQQRWFKLELPPSLKRWDEAAKDSGSPSTLAALIDAVLDGMGIEVDGERSTLCPPTGTKPEKCSDFSP